MAAKAGMIFVFVLLALWIIFLIVMIVRAIIRKHYVEIYEGRYLKLSKPRPRFTPVSQSSLPIPCLFALELQATQQDEGGHLMTIEGDDDDGIITSKVTIDLSMETTKTEANNVISIDRDFTVKYTKKTEDDTIEVSFTTKTETDVIKIIPIEKSRYYVAFFHPLGGAFANNISFEKWQIGSGLKDDKTWFRARSVGIWFSIVYDDLLDKKKEPIAKYDFHNQASTFKNKGGDEKFEKFELVK